MDVSLSLDDGDVSPAEMVEALDALPGVLQDRLERAATDIGQRIRGGAAERAPVDTGQLASSIEAIVDTVGAAIVQIRVGSNLDQAGPQEFGTDPHFPPPSALRDWARRVLGNPNLAYPVARSIADSGIEEQPYLRPAFRENLEWALDRITQAVDNAFEEVRLA